MMTSEANRSASTLPSNPFPSLDALRDAHKDLLEVAGLNLEPSASSATAKQKHIVDFMSRSVATGAILDAPADRRTAQSFIDYWVASLYTSARQEPDAGATSPEPIRYSLPRRLAAFDAGAVRDVEHHGEQILEALSPRDLELARRILMHLIRLSERNGACVGAPQRRHALLALGELGAATTILDRLIDVRVLKQIHSGQNAIIELQYMALTRQWGRLAHWIEERTRFRDAALFWDRGGRKRGALLGPDVAGQANAYGDLNTLELNFLRASEHKLRALIAAAVSLAVLLSAGLPVFEYAYRTWWVPFRAPEIIREVKSEVSSPQTKSDGIRWLAHYDQPLDFSGISFFNINLVDAELQAPAFVSGRLINSNFNNAKINAGRFQNAIIENTTFSNAQLYNSTFDGSRFCRGVDFSNTDLRATTFRGVQFDGDTAPVVKNALWWGAEGWSWEQVKILKLQDQSSIEKSGAFREETAAAYRNVQTSPADTLDRAMALNKLAWVLALYGAELDRAKGAAQEAVQIAALAKEPNREREFRDTLGYILLQKGDHVQALPHLKFAGSLEDPGHIFRYAVALFASGEENEGIVYLQKAISKDNFIPDDEAVLMRSYIVGNFEKELDRLLAERRRSPQPESQIPAQGGECPLPSERLK